MTPHPSRPTRIQRASAVPTRRRLLWVAGASLLPCVGPVLAAGKTLLRVSSPAVPDDWHAKMWTVLNEQLEAQAPGQFEVQINLNASLFKQGAEPVAMARGNLELASLSAFDMAKQVSAFSIFTAGYVVRDPGHLMRVFNGPIGDELFQSVAEKMDIVVLAPLYLGTRQLGLRDTRAVKTPADLKNLKLRMPASKEWLFLGNALGASATPLAFAEVYLGLKTGTIDGEDNPLPTVRSAKFYEALKQIVLTGHLVDSLFISVAKKTWDALAPAQQKALRSAAQAASKFNNDKRIDDEKQLLDFFKAQGLAISTPDRDAFRKTVTAAYAESEYAKVWPKDLLARIHATP